MSHATDLHDADLPGLASIAAQQLDARGRRIIDELASMLPAEAIITDPGAMGAYQQDRAVDPNAGMPVAVVLPLTTEHVQVAVQWAAERKVPVVPRGAGTGLSGGATAITGGIVLSTERMRSITVDPVTRTAVVQPGLLNVEVKAAAAAEGLWYPPDPASYEICTIGGNAATNAGGLCCVKYGVTSDYILGMEVVMADGRVVRIGGPRLKDVAGLSMLKLFVGSEGTLGIITELTLRLLPPAPPERTVVGWFSSSREAAAAILDIASSIRPSMLEYMDATSINAVEDVLEMGLHRHASALVVARSDDQSPSGAEIATMLNAFHRHGAFDAFEVADRQEGERFANARRIAIPAVERMGTLLLEDVGVSIPRLAELTLGVEKIAKSRDVVIAFIAHAGDGNTHPLIVFNPDDDDMKERAYLAYGEVMDLAIQLGGTITGEHGVGRLKQPWLVDQIGEDLLEISHNVKKALDPAGILNPGTIFAASGDATNAGKGRP
ncbi:glycolate oxidase [Pseudarthrobacter siccitolerans]|uniref:Glycolate oxidase n=1 Tax=Pseudarthrobacter siccitolerans TaxID=861266 RepID=A0ABU0PMA8_9MICC|nr:FAD-linked oxidase C-terminal domain-containing protein [Pseudarthrobacter siccitolerans]MDQ0675091.1 glycolate oxidase [Pseudarthrobacter siccitolerans]